MNTSYTGGYVGPQELTQEAQSTQAANAAPVSPAETPQLPLQNADQNLDDLKTQQLQQDSWGNKVYHGVLSALGGKYDTQFIPTPQGVVQTQVANAPGQQWKRIISGAITGLGGAAAAGTQGPGGTMRGLGGGIQAGYGQRVAEEGHKEEQANTQFSQEQAAAMNTARQSIMASEVAKNAWTLSYSKKQAYQSDLVSEANLMKMYEDAKGDGAIDMGVMPTFQDFVKKAATDPTLTEKHAVGQIIPNMHVNAAGDIDGVHAIWVPKQWQEKKATEDYTYQKPIEWDDKGRPTKYQSFTTGVSTGATNSEVQSVKLANAMQVGEYHIKEENANTQRIEAQAKADLVPSEKAKNEAQATALNQAVDSTTIQSNAMQLVEGSMDPTNLSRRSKSYDATLAAANTYSMAKYGRPFNPAKAISDYKYASNKNTQDTLKYLNSLTGRDNNSGNLGELINVSNSLPRTNFPALNDVAAWGRLASGNTKIVQYQTAVTEVADQVAKILQGGSGSGTSDSKLKQAQALFDKGFNKDQMEGVAHELRSLLANRKNELIGDNVYLDQWYKPTPGSATRPPPPSRDQAPQGAGGVRWDGTQSKYVWTDKDGKDMLQ